MFEHTIETRGSLFLRSLGAEYLIRPLGLQLRMTQFDVGGLASTPLGTSKATKSSELGGMEIDESDPTTNIASDFDGVGSTLKVIVEVVKVGTSANVVGACTIGNEGALDDKASARGVVPEEGNVV